MNILVTGGAGYIGSHCVKALLDQGDQVIVIDNLSTGYKKALDKRAKFYQVDIRDKDHVANILIKEKIESVIHFAAFSLVGESMINPLKYYENNVYGTQKLLEAMIEADVQYIVFSSTAAVYGEQIKMPITEDADEHPTNTYGQTKLAMEKMLKWADKAHDIKSIALRYFNVAGAHHTGSIGEAHNPETHLIPLVLQVPNYQRETISIFGTDYDTPDGTCIRDYIHVEDLIQAHILAMNHLIKTNKSDYFNLGSGTGYSVLEIIEAARKVTNHPIPAKEDLKRPGDPPILIASSEKAHRILKWHRQYNDIQDIIASAWKFHKEHKGGYHD
jgi:UDP-glucose 4-epimerase